VLTGTAPGLTLGGLLEQGSPTALLPLIRQDIVADRPADEFDRRLLSAFERLS